MTPLWMLAIAAGPATAAPAAQAAADGSGSGLLFTAGVLMLLGALLLLIEFFVVSAGMLSVAAVTSAGIAIAIAFQVSTTAGLSFTLATPVIAGVVVWFGLNRLRNSPAIPRTAITADAGAHHVAERAGATVGAVGTLVTDAFPTGRARFGDHEVDVQVRGAALRKGSAIRVAAIDGPVILVTVNHDAP
jgi:membrane-bound ClpP family serine protease